MPNDAPTMAAQVVPLSKFRKSSAAYAALRRRIMLRHLQPGAALTELNLAAELGCSQGTVREALLRLQEDGLVNRSGYRGTYVSTTSAAEARQMVVLRLQIEQAGIRQAVHNVDDALLAELAALIEAMERSARDGDEYAGSETDRLFHRRILEAADLPALVPMLVRCSLHIHRFTIGFPGSKDKLLVSAQRHWEVLDALRGGSGDCAAMAIVDHIRRVVDDGTAELRAALEHALAP